MLGGEYKFASFVCVCSFVHKNIQIDSLPKYSLFLWRYMKFTFQCCTASIEDCTGVASMPCDENAMCEELPKRSNFTCTCIPPYVGNGITCSRGKCL